MKSFITSFLIVFLLAFTSFAQEKIPDSTAVTVGKVYNDVKAAKLKGLSCRYAFTPETVSFLLGVIDDLEFEAYTNKIYNYIFANKDNIIENTKRNFEENSFKAGFYTCLQQFAELKETKILIALQELEQKINHD